MKIYWKNLIWNYTVRYWLMFKWRNTKWKKYHYRKLIWNSKQKAELKKQMKSYIDKSLWFYCNQKYPHGWGTFKECSEEIAKKRKNDIKNDKFNY